MRGARSAALTALQKWRKNDAWSDAALNSAISQSGLDARDAALASRICYGTIQNLALLDHILSHCCDRPLRQLEPRVLDILRIGAYQLWFMDRIPARAAVNESVALCKDSGCARASGLVNAVLRRVSALDRVIPNLPDEGTSEYLSVRYSHPLWLCERLIQEHGYAFAEQAVSANNADAPACLQCNQLRVDASRVAADLSTAGYDVKCHPHLPDALVCIGGDFMTSRPFADGWFYVQDAAAKYAVLIADPQPGMRVLDACAAPGGKSFAAAIQMQDQGEILACDIHENKLRRICSGSDRLGIRCIQTQAMDARKPDASIGLFDVVLADVPCSGLGVIRKKPEIRYKDAAEIALLPDIQLEILRGLSTVVKPGGVLMYSTCTILPEENEKVVESFLKEHPEYELEPIHLPWLEVPNGMHTFWPHVDDTDGFFTAKLRKYL